jgi:hypothetical protein
VTAVAFVFGALPLPAAAVQSVPSAEDAARARDLAAAYMQRSVGSDGKFAYIVDMDPEADVPREYNVVRHAGALWSMCDYYGIRPSAGMYGAIGRASAYLRDRRLRPLPGRSDLLAVWSDTEDDGDDPSAKLGGSGLGLVALTAAERPSAVPKADNVQSVMYCSTCRRSFPFVLECAVFCVFFRKHRHIVGRHSAPVCFV